MVLVTSCTSVIWEVPGAEPDAASAGATKLYSVLLSLFLCFAGSGIWKRWEVRTPGDEQFAVCEVLKKRLEDEGDFVYLRRSRGDISFSIISSTTTSPFVSTDGSPYMLMEEDEDDTQVAGPSVSQEKLKIHDPMFI